MNPGGWIETCDIMSPLVSDDGSLTENSSLLRWNKLLLEATIKAGVPADSLKHYKQQMRDAGFQHVTEVKFKWPTNTWPKDKRHKEIGE